MGLVGNGWLWGWASKSERGAGLCGPLTSRGAPFQTSFHTQGVPWDREPRGASCHEPLSVPLSNLIKAATGEGEGGGLGKTQKNLAGSTHVTQNNSGAAVGLLRRREVTEEEAER